MSEAFEGKQESKVLRRGSCLGICLKEYHHKELGYFCTFQLETSESFDAYTKSS
jgi:hypothetical protein